MKMMGTLLRSVGMGEPWGNGRGSSTVLAHCYGLRSERGGCIPNSPKPHGMGAGRLYCRWAPIHFLDSRRRFLPRRRMVDRARRFHRAGQRGLAEPDSATRDDENHPSRVRNALWIARDAPDA